MRLILSVIIILSIGVIFAEGFYIGNPTSTIWQNVTPFNLPYRQSLNQTIYYQDELHSGYITAIGYNFSRSTEVEGGYPDSNKHIKIWMKTTDKTSFTTNSDFSPYIGFILVYDGTIPINQEGVSDIIILLDTQFIYEGGNLIVMTQRMHEEAAYSHLNTWLSTATPGTFRTVTFFQNAPPITDISEGYPIFAPQNSDRYAVIPNTYFEINTDPIIHVAVNGTVLAFDTGAGLEGAIVTLQGSVYLSTSTNTYGEFTFPSVYGNNTYTLSVTVPHYQDYVDVNITVGEDPLTIPSITLYEKTFPPRNVRALFRESSLKLTWDIPNRSVTGYHIYRATPNDIENESLWTTIDTNITVNNYTDTTWATLELGEYIYLIKAVYTGDFFSPPALSNTINKRDVLFSEGFEVLEFPAGWVQIANNPVYPWVIRNSINVTGFYGLQQVFYPYYYSNGMAASQSYVNAGGVYLDPDNWLITPQIQIGVDSEEALLEYYVSTHYDWQDHYGVYISTTGNAPVDFNLLFEETAPIGTTAEQVWFLRSINLDEYIGQSIYIGFRHFDSNGRYWLMIDEVTVFGKEAAGAIGDWAITPVTTVLYANYPNPFNPSTIITFDVARDGHVLIEVYNIRGQKVKEVISGSFSGGRHSVVWDGRDVRGKAVSSGVYFYRMVTDDFHSVKKMLLVK